LPKTAREIPRDVAAFGERQFKETGAQSVDVLRVKASVMRKHFRQLKGITYLVAVVSLDRVRIYFFNSAGMMLVGENVEPLIYQKIRSSSKLVVKYEKPKELTPEEQRIEATQELRDALTKAIRRVARFLNSTQPSFPDIFITRMSSTEKTQCFGLQTTDDGEYLFEEKALKTGWFDGIVTRTAFLAHLNPEISKWQMASLIGNGIALALLKDPGRKIFREFWSKISKETDLVPYVNHLIRHIDCYSSLGFIRFYTLLKEIPPKNAPQHSDLRTPFDIIHNSMRVSIGTEEYHVLSKFCQTLSDTRKLSSRKNTLESIHLAPRVICDTSSLDNHISLSYGLPSINDWASVSFIDNNDIRTLRIGMEEGAPLTAMEYYLNLEDIYPTSGGLVSHGKNILQRVITSLGISKKPTSTFETSIAFSRAELEGKETAVLERLSLGKLDILTNTLVGSPKIVDMLLKTGKIVFLPDFNHIGIDMEYLVQGESDIIRSVVQRTCLEATTFVTDSDSIAVVSAPSTWRSGLFDEVIAEGLSLWPIHRVISEKKILRSEDSFSAEAIVTWTDGVI